MWKRGQTKASVAKEEIFQLGDEVYICKGPHRNVTGVVFKLMPVMMDVQVANGTSNLTIVKCKQSNARLIKRSTAYTFIPRQPDNVETGMDRAHAIDELQQAIQELERDHRAKLERITSLIEKITLMD